MKFSASAVSTTLALSFLAAPTMSHSQDLLQGDTKLACEAILCLSTGQRPNECSPSIQRYFSIRHKKSWDTINARRNFLQLCPKVNSQQGMPELINAIANGAGMCDANTLNFTLRNRWGSWSDDQRTQISNVMPAHCGAYFGNAFTYFENTKPRYVGTPSRGGYWVEANQYAAELARYNARIAAEDAAAAAQQQWWNQGGN